MGKKRDNSRENAQLVTIAINVFDNAFVYQSRRLDVNSTSTRGRIKNHYGSYFEFVRDGDVLVPDVHNDVAVFDGTFDGVEIVEVRVHEIIDVYTSDEEGFKDIDKETYDKLSPNFQKKYRSVSANEVYETRHDVLIETTEHVGRAFDLNTYLGENVSELRKILDGEDYTPRPLMKNLAPRQLNSVNVLKVLQHLYTQEQNELNQLRADFRVTERNYSLNRNRNDYLSVEYFVRPYNGEKKKVYARKSNGRRYADGRGRMVADFPNVASKVIVHEEDLDTLQLVGDDVENLSIIRSLYHAIFHPAQG